ncbi:MAG: helix-turn-helix domain-containing protein [Opitutaceae bacterium]|nr:helix-turn-helix domain-containing protein [Opitutaceae bacterium]
MSERKRRFITLGGSCPDIEGVPKHRESTRLNIHPGELLREEFVKPLGLTQVELSKRSNIPVVTLRKLMNGKHGVTLEIDSGLTESPAHVTRLLATRTMRIQQPALERTRRVAQEAKTIEGVRCGPAGSMKRDPAGLATQIAPAMPIVSPAAGPTEVNRQNLANFLRRSEIAAQLDEGA